jgi:hypothetical protein
MEFLTLSNKNKNMKPKSNPPAIGTFGIDWNNIDLTDSYEASRNLIEGMTFDTLLLEINCNLPNITLEAVEAQFEADLKSRVREARDIFRMNKVSITRHARKARRE